MGKSKIHDSHLKNYQYPDEFGSLLGYKVLKIDRKRWQGRAELTLREAHLSPAGRVHGGVISSFFDFLCGAAVFASMEPNDFCSTVELKVNYFRPLDVGDHLEGRSDVVFRGKRLCVVQGFLYRKRRGKLEDQPVAMASATFNIVAGK